MYIMRILYVDKIIYCIIVCNLIPVSEVVMSNLNNTYIHFPIYTSRYKEKKSFYKTREILINNTLLPIHITCLY